MAQPTIMEYSKQLKKIASQFSVPVPTLIMADLIIAGYSEDDAYNIAYAHNAALSADKRNAQQEKIIASSVFQRILTEKGHQSDLGQDLIDSETALKHLLKQIQKMPDGKEKADLYAKYLDSMRKTNAQPEDEESRVQIYLPLKCRDCSLYLNRNKKSSDLPLSPKIPQ